VEARFAANYFCLFSVFAVVTPYFQALLRWQGLTTSQIGFVFSGFAVVGILTPPLWGWFSDHSHHRRSLLALAIVGAGVTFTLFGWIAHFWIALAAALLFSFFYHPIIPLTDGQVVRYLSEHGGDYGRPRTAGSVAFVVMMGLLEWLGVADRASGPTIVIRAMAIGCLAHAASVALLPLTERERAERADPRQKRRHFDWAILRRRPFVLFCLVAFLGRFGMTAYYGSSPCS